MHETDSFGHYTHLTCVDVAAVVCGGACGYIRACAYIYRKEERVMRNNAFALINSKCARKAKHKVRGRGLDGNLGKSDARSHYIAFV